MLPRKKWPRLRSASHDAIGRALALLRATLDATSEGLLLLDPAGRVVTYNEQFLELFGVPVALAESGDGERVLAHVLARLEEPEGLDGMLATTAEHPEADTHGRLELADGRHVQAGSNPREVLGTRFRVWVFRDVTLDVRARDVLRASAELEADLAERSRRLRELETALLGAVSHSVRTPLSSVLGFARALRAGGVDDDPVLRADMLERLERNAQKLDRLLADLLDVDALMRGTLQAHRTRTDVAELIRRLVSETPGLPRDRIAIHAGDAVAMVDPEQVRRMIEHLVRNAVKYSPAGTRIRLSAIRDDEGLRITVEDEGPGVPEDLRETIFEPFRQVPGVSEHAPGLGLGLGLVAGVAKLHGGKAWVEPRPGGGAVFHVVLPA